MPSFLFLLSLVGKTLGRGTGSHCPPATISKPFILPLQRGESKSKGDKSACPTKDIEKRGKEGRVVGERGRSREKALRPKQKPKTSQSQGSDSGDTRTGRERAAWGSAARQPRRR